MEDDPNWHHGALSELQLEGALAELGASASQPDPDSGRLFADV